MIVASRYAKSLIDLSIAEKQLEEVRKDMALIDQTCRESREFAMLLASPIVKTDKKVAVLKQIFEGKVSKVTLAFLNMIASKRREDIIPEIASAFEEQYKEHKNIITAVVTTAAPLDAATKAKMLELVKQKIKGEIDLVEKVNKDLIGGFVLTVNDKQIDASIRRKLNEMKKDFSGNVYAPQLN